MKLKIKLPKNPIFLVLLILVIIALLTVLGMFLYNIIVPGPEPERPLTTWNYKGSVVGFRADLREADKVPAYPGETPIYLDTIHPLVKNVTIAFKDAGEDENAYYIVEELEIVTKMILVYRNMLAGYPGLTEDDMPGFNAIPVENYNNLPGKIQNPIIALVHPKYANETAVRNEGHVTYISGKTHEEFDLATVKFLMIVLGIELP